MLIHHIIILLLSWPCVRAIENEKPPPEDAIDQVATASENQRVPFEESKNSALVSESLRSSTTPSPINVATIHYENSNGFVPMSSIGDGAGSTKALDLKTSSEDHEPEVGLKESHDSEKIEDDPAYSTEARMFLNIAGLNAGRRSFDTQEGQSEFELLKVTNETPAIANYHEFYENMQNNLARNRGGTQAGYGDESGAGTTASQNKKTKDRIQHIDKYLTNYQTNEDQAGFQPVEQFYNNYQQSGKARSVNRQKDIFEPAKVQSFADHSAASNYDVYNEAAASQRQKTLSQQKPKNHDAGVTSSRQNYPAMTQKSRYSKPVIVVEPSDYKLDMKYGTQQVLAKSSSVDTHRSPTHRKASSGMELTSQYDEESRLNREDRYGPSYERSEDVGDYSGEEEYMEITEKPRRIHKSRRRPYGAENSRRLPKEHRSHNHENQASLDPRKNNSPTRSKLHRPRAKPSYWIEDDRGPSSEENSEEVINRPNVTPRPEDKKAKQSSKSKGGPSWSQVAPNIEVSHSNGFEIGHMDKPKLLVPVNLNVLPLGNFDHSAAIGTSQGFDFTNVPNFVTATPLVSSQAPMVSTSHSVINNGHPNSANPPKNNQNSGNNHYGLSTPAPDIIVGQNTYHNPVQAVLLPHMNANNKFPPNLRPHYSPSTVAPMFTVTHALNNNLHNVAPTMASIPVQGYHSTVSPHPANPINQQHMQHFTVNPSAPQLLLPQPTLQSYPLMNAHYNGPSNYNILVNPNGLHGQNVIQHGNGHSPGSDQNVPSSTTTPQPILMSNNNYHSAETQVRKNVAGNGNGQFLTTASFSVANDVHQGASSTTNENKFYLPTNNNINHFHNGNQNNQQQSPARPSGQENLYQIYRGDQNSNGKVKTFIQAAQVVPTFIHHANALPINLNNQHLTNFGGQLQEQQSILTPNVVVHAPRNQNQQILNAANDIFENTWKQLQQLRSNEDAARQLPFQHVYRVNDNLGSTSNANGNTINALPGANVNSANAHLPIMANQNVEIINPNIKPSPVDLSMINPYGAFNHYPAAVLTTPIPIFSTTANFLAPRPIVASTTPAPINLQNYVDHLTNLGSQVNKAETARPVTNHQENQRPVFNPINFVPNSDLMKSQSMLNSKNTEPLPNQLNLVPVIPGGNFFKNSPGAQTELVQKPRLSSDLEKYAEEMFKESLKTIYSTHKWNTDRRLRGNYSAAELNELAKLKSELQRYKASLLDSKYGPKDILEAHHSEPNVRTAESSSRPAKKPELSMADIEQLFKSDFKLSLPNSGDSSHRGSNSKNRPGPGHGSSRPGTSGEHSNEFRNMKHLSDYLTPPKVNSFLSKSPFIDSPKPGKKRPGSHPRFNSPNGNNRHLPRPSSLVSRPSSNPDASASNHVESGVKADGHHRYEKYRSYPTFTTTSSSESDVFKPSSGEQFSKNDYYDINHPRMHNLLGLLMKNKQLPKGSPQSFFRDDDELRQYFENDRRRVHTDFFNESPINMQKKSYVPNNMGPPAPPHLAQVRPYPTRIL